MTIMQQNLTIHMIRTDLSGLPHFDLPPGFALRWYKPGDDRTWCRIHLAADRYNPISPDLFHGEFGWDDARLQARQCYLLSPDGGAVGTATAWLDDDYYGERYGRIHWVAILPDWQGRGLAKPLLSSACARLQELGHDRAYLVTSTARIPAISLYLKFGFVPHLRTPEDGEVWRQLAGPLGARLDLAKAVRRLE